MGRALTAGFAAVIAAGTLVGLPRPARSASQNDLRADLHPSVTASAGGGWAHASVGRTGELSTGYNANGQDIRAGRLCPAATPDCHGLYRVQFDGVSAGAFGVGRAAVTGYDPDRNAASCSIIGWSYDTLDVKCVGRVDGNPVDSGFTAELSYRRTTTSYVVSIDAAATALVTPPPARNYNSAGLVNTVQRTGKGTYVVTLPGVASASAPNVNVTAVQSGATCGLLGLPERTAGPGSGTARLRVRCTRAGLGVGLAGVVDSPFVASYANGTSLTGATPYSTAQLIWTQNSSIKRTSPGFSMVAAYGGRGSGSVRVQIVGSRPLTDTDVQLTAISDGGVTCNRVYQEGANTTVLVFLVRCTSTQGGAVADPPAFAMSYDESPTPSTWAIGFSRPVGTALGNDYLFRSIQFRRAWRTSTGPGLPVVTRDTSGNGVLRGDPSVQGKIVGRFRRAMNFLSVRSTKLDVKLLGSGSVVVEFYGPDGPTEDPTLPKPPPLATQTVTAVDRWTTVSYSRSDAPAWGFVIRSATAAPTPFAIDNVAITRWP